MKPPLETAVWYWPDADMLMEVQYWLGVAEDQFVPKFETSK